MPTQLTPEIINAAIEGFEAQKRRIDAQIAKIRQMLEQGRDELAFKSAAPKRRKFSADARRRMKEAQQRRWAKIRGEPTPASTAPKAAKPKRKLSQAGRAAIVAALKKRWAAKRASAEKPGATVARKAAPKIATRKKVAAKTSAVKASLPRAAKTFATQPAAQ